MDTREKGQNWSRSSCRFIRIHSKFASGRNVVDIFCTHTQPKRGHFCRHWETSANWLAQQRFRFFFLRCVLCWHIRIVWTLSAGQTIVIRLFFFYPRTQTMLPFCKICTLFFQCCNPCLDCASRKIVRSNFVAWMQNSLRLFLLLLRIWYINWWLTFQL